MKIQNTLSVLLRNPYGFEKNRMEMRNVFLGEEIMASWLPRAAAAGFLFLSFEPVIELGLLVVVLMQMKMHNTHHYRY